MHTQTIADWQHPHTFGQNEIRSGERRTLTVVVLTGVMMAVEIVAGLVYGSLALLADGIHMGSHMAALSISLFAYIYARKFAHDDRFSFGTGKVNALAGYSSALLLLLVALMMGYQSLERFLHPVTIHYNQAIAVAVIGLLVNGLSIFILGDKGHAQEHEDEHEHVHQHGERDHNLRAAYLHVFADAMTSVLAISALLGAKYFNFVWMDPLMGIVGGLLVTQWSVSLLRASSRVLLDYQVSALVRQRVVASLESYQDTRVSDLHIWCIGPGIYCSSISVVTRDPQPSSIYRQLIPAEAGVVHATIEVLRCPG